MNDSFLVFTDNVDAQFQGVIFTDFARVRLAVFWRQSMAVDEGTIGRLHISNPDFAALIGPDLRMLPGKNFGIKIPVH